MTTNPFLLDRAVDTSIIGRDNGVRVESNPSGGMVQTGFSVLGEAYLTYKYADFIATLVSLALKGIWVEDNSGASADGAVKQLQLLT